MVVDVYYEVLCPDSRYFILKQLYPAWQKVQDIMDVRFKPFGKAQVSQLQSIERICGSMCYYYLAEHGWLPPRLMYFRSVLNSSTFT